MATINMYDNALSVRASIQPGWWVQALTGSRVISDNKVTVITGVNGTSKLNLLIAEGSMLQPDGSDCAWTPDVLAKLMDKDVYVKTFKTNKEECVQDLERARTNLMLKAGANNVAIPEDLLDATIHMSKLRISNEVQHKVFFSDASASSYDFDGFVPILKNSNEAVKLIGTDLKKDNIVNELDKVVSSIPEDVLAKGLEDNSLVIYISPASILQLKLAASTMNNGNVIISQNLEYSGDTVHYLGLELVPVKGMDNSTMIAADIKNMLMITDLLNDTEYIRVGYFPAPNDNKIFIDSRMRLGADIGFPNEVVFYSKLNTEQAEDSTRITKELTNINLDDFDINLSISNIKPFIEKAEDADLLRLWLDQENAKEQPRDSVVKLIQCKIDKLNKTNA